MVLAPMAVKAALVDAMRSDSFILRRFAPTKCVTEPSFLKAAAAAAESGDVVLMSPASASFDEFKNFAVRGDFFKKLIMEL